MDTLETRVTMDKGGFKIYPPILWKDKTAEQVHREQHPEHQLKRNPDPPRSLRSGVEYCRSFVVSPHRKERGSEDGHVYSTLTEIDK